MSFFVVLLHGLYGLRILIDGWQQTEQPGLKPLMALYTGLLALLFALSCLAIAYAAHTGQLS